MLTTPGPERNYHGIWGFATMYEATASVCIAVMAGIAGLQFWRTRRARRPQVVTLKLASVALTFAWAVSIGLDAATTVGDALILSAGGALVVGYLYERYALRGSSTDPRLGP